MRGWVSRCVRLTVMLNCANVELCEDGLWHLAVQFVRVAWN